MGGIALGNGVMSSGLLKVLDGIIRNLINGYTLYTVVLILSPVVLVKFPFNILFGICLIFAPFSFFS